MSPTPVGRTRTRMGRQIVEGPGNRVVTILLALSGEKMIPFAQVAQGPTAFSRRYFVSTRNPLFRNPVE